MYTEYANCILWKRKSSVFFMCDYQLENYGQNLGIAFQIVDDILDEISNQETLGKSSAVAL